jgi:hypothetical protein
MFTFVHKYTSIQVQKLLFYFFNLINLFIYFINILNCYRIYLWYKYEIKIKEIEELNHTIYFYFKLYIKIGLFFI